MKSRDGKSQRREEKKTEDHKRESLRRKKIQVREKVGKSEKCTPLWREAHLQVKKLRTAHVRSTF
jgi:hypothetical protein